MGWLVRPDWPAGGRMGWLVRPDGPGGPGGSHGNRSHGRGVKLLYIFAASAMCCYRAACTPAANLSCGGCFSGSLGRSMQRLSRACAAQLPVPLRNRILMPRSYPSTHRELGSACSARPVHAAVAPPTHAPRGRGRAGGRASGRAGARAFRAAPVTKSRSPLVPCPSPEVSWRNGCGRVPDASHTMEYEETDSSRTRRAAHARRRRCTRRRRRRRRRARTCVWVCGSWGGGVQPKAQGGTGGRRIRKNPLEAQPKSEPANGRPPRARPSSSLERVDSALSVGQLGDAGVTSPPPGVTVCVCSSPERRMGKRPRTRPGRVPHDRDRADKTSRTGKAGRACTQAILNTGYSRAPGCASDRADCLVSVGTSPARDRVSLFVGPGMTLHSRGEHQPDSLTMPWSSTVQLCTPPPPGGGGGPAISFAPGWSQTAGAAPQSSIPGQSTTADMYVDGQLGRQQGQKNIPSASQHAVVPADGEGWEWVEAAE
eukprot:gene15345-biopygen5188